MLRNNAKRCNHVLVLCLLAILFFNAKITTFALERNDLQEGNDSQKLEGGEIAPYAEWVDVPSCQYMLKHYDGSVTLMPIVYKQINVPSGCKVVSNGPTLAYYEGTRYAAVSRHEWTHTVVRQ